MNRDDKKNETRLPPAPGGWRGPATERVRIALEYPSDKARQLEQFIHHKGETAASIQQPLEEQYQDPAARYFESRLASLMAEKLNDDKDSFLWPIIKRVSEKIITWTEFFKSKDAAENRRSLLHESDFNTIMDIHNYFFSQPFHSAKNAPDGSPPKQRAATGKDLNNMPKSRRGRYPGPEVGTFDIPGFSGIMLPWQPQGELPKRPENRFSISPVQMHRPDFESIYVRGTTPRGLPFAWGLSGHTAILLGGAFHILPGLTVIEKEQYLLAVTAWLVNLGWHSFDETARVGFQYYDLLQVDKEHKLAPYLNASGDADFERFFHSAPEMAALVERAWNDTIKYVKENINKPLGEIPAWVKGQTFPPTNFEFKRAHGGQPTGRLGKHKQEVWEMNREFEHHVNHIAKHALEEADIHQAYIYSKVHDGKALIKIDLPQNITKAINIEELHTSILRQLVKKYELKVELSRAGSTIASTPYKEGKAKSFPLL